MGWLGGACDDGARATYAGVFCVPRGPHVRMCFLHARGFYCDAINNRRCSEFDLTLFWAWSAWNSLRHNC